MTALPLKLMDRYVLKQLAEYFLLGVVVFTLIAFFSDTLLKFAREIQKYGISFGTLLTMIGLQLPRSIALVIPASCFLAVLMVYNQLNNQFEVIAMRMNGISLWRLMKPAMLLGLFCTVMTYALNDYVVPWCNVKTEEMKEQVMRSGMLPSNGSSFMYRTYDDDHNLRQLIYVSQYEGRKLGDTTMVDLTRKGVMQIVQARSGTWDPKSGWALRNANIYLVANDVQHSSAGHSESFLVKNLIKDSEAEETRREEFNRRLMGVDIDSDQQSFWDLWTTIKKREAMGLEVARNNYLKMWAKLTWPLGCVAIILSAVPLSMSPPRQGSNRGFLYAIIILFLFYQLNSIFHNLARVIYPDFGGLLSLQTYLVIMAWIPMALITAIGILLLRRKSLVL